MRIDGSWQVKLPQILLGVAIVILLVVVRGTNAGNKPVHLATDWSHRHLVFSTPKSEEQRIRLLSNPRYVQQGIRRNAENKGRGDAWRWSRTEAKPLHGDWSMYMGYNGNPAAIVPGTAGAGNYPAKFSFDVTSAYCETPAPPAGQQPDFVVFNTSLTGSAIAFAAIDTAMVTAEPASGQTITITNGATTLTLTAGTTTSTTGTGAGTFIRSVNTTTQASNIAASINLTGNGSFIGVSAISAGNVLTVAATITGTSGNNILVGGNAAGVTWSFGQLQDGATGIPSIIAFDNLYAGTCTGSWPLDYWAYNTGGQVVTSPTLSGDGTQVAFVQNVGTRASLVLLKWAAHTGDVNNPVTLTTQTSAAAYRSCTAPCMLTVALGGTAALDTHSSPFYDFSNNVLYVGDDNGFLHKFTGVFYGNPAEVVSASTNI